MVYMVAVPISPLGHHRVRLLVTVPDGPDSRRRAITCATVTAAVLLAAATARHLKEEH